jgi:uncharacterized membrane protein
MLSFLSSLRRPSLAGVVPGISESVILRKFLAYQRSIKTIKINPWGAGDLLGVRMVIRVLMVWK